MGSESMTTPENTIIIIYFIIILFVCHLKILHKHCLRFLLGVKIAPRETENNAYTKFWDDKKSIIIMVS